MHCHRATSSSGQSLLSLTCCRHLRSLDAKRRFSSYIFHEVRVPLNTALLAVQNLTHTQGYNNGSEAAEEFAALEGSLQMMSQVLNVSLLRPR